MDSVARNQVSIERRFARFRWYDGVFVTAALLIGGVAAATPSGAHHGPDSIFPSANIYGGDVDCEAGRLCKADSATHTVYIEQLGPKMTAATQHVLGDYDADTDLSIVYHDSSQVTYSGSWETDVIFVNRNSLPSNVWGRAVCDDASPGNGKCDQFYVLYHADKIDADVPNDVSFHQTIACHETGHTLGLLHGSNADPAVSSSQFDFRCMRTSPLPDDPVIGTHNTDQIDANY